MPLPHLAPSLGQLPLLASCLAASAERAALRASLAPAPLAWQQQAPCGGRARQHRTEPAAAALIQCAKMLVPRCCCHVYGSGVCVREEP